MLGQGGGESKGDGKLKGASMISMGMNAEEKEELQGEIDEVHDKVENMQK